jgi:FixJ family two-component response regulator
MNTDMPTLFVVDDDPGARRSAAALASSIGVACETYSSAESFLQSFDPSCPGCVLIDLRLNGMSGFELQEELAARGSDLPVIVISAYVDVPATVRLMRNGALTVLEKPYQADELAETIRLAFETDRQRRTALAERRWIRQRINSLCPREKQTMELIVAGRPNKLIARQLDVSHRTVDRLRAAVFRKIGVDTAVELARVVGELRACGETAPAVLSLSAATSAVEASFG